MVMIYALQSSSDRRIRYIGQTTYPLHKRLKGHIAWAKTKTNDFASWIIDEFKKGTLEIVNLFETDTPDVHERRLIAELSEVNQLFNIRRGGKKAAPRILMRPILVEPDNNDTLLITCPSLPGVVTFAASPKEIVARANEAIEVFLISIVTS